MTLEQMVWGNLAHSQKQFFKIHLSRLTMKKPYKG